MVRTRVYTFEHYSILLVHSSTALEISDMINKNSQPREPFLTLAAHFTGLTVTTVTPPLAAELKMIVDTMENESPGIFGNVEAIRTSLWALHVRRDYC